MKYILLEETDSTNTYITRHLDELESMTIVTATRQSRGRGQRGNSWESESGKNLTVSVLWRPENYPARSQFSISEAVALAVADTLRSFGINASVKWPNDIYVGDRKIAGILIEHAVGGHHIMHTIIGIGLNVNQTVFRSDAPNPVSMAQLTDETYDLMEVLAALSDSLTERLNASDRDSLHSEYISSLWRADGRFYPFATPDGRDFDAAIAGVDHSGMLTLVTPEGVMTSYAFKEVIFRL